MEDVLEVYTRPYDPKRPLVRIDETNKQLLSGTREPLPMKPGKPQCYGYEYDREGVANLFLCCEPLLGKRHVFEIHYTPKHGSWLKMAEGEITETS